MRWWIGFEADTKSIPVAIQWAIGKRFRFWEGKKSIRYVCINISTHITTIPIVWWFSVADKMIPLASRQEKFDNVTPFNRFITRTIRTCHLLVAIIPYMYIEACICFYCYCCINQQFHSMKMNNRCILWLWQSFSQ